jgi:hypothetical protein
MSPTLTREDAEQLRLLSIGHYVVAGLQALFGFFPVIHLVIGIWMLASPEAQQGKDGAPPAIVASMFIGFALVWMLAAWTMAALLVVAGRNIAARRRRTFCLVVAAVIAVLCMPFGTILGVFSLVVLLRPSVRAAFDGPPAAGASAA